MTDFATVPKGIVFQKESGVDGEHVLEKRIARARAKYPNLRSAKQRS
jgi:hypothetical protein